MHTHTFQIQLPPGVNNVAFVLTPDGAGGFNLTLQPIAGAAVQQSRPQPPRARMRGNEHLLFSLN